MKDKTLREIKNTFCDLLNEKDIDKITVTEICSLVEINRGTFYRYYNDVYDLLEQIENEFFAKIQTYTQLILDLDQFKLERITLFLESLKKERRILKPIIIHSYAKNFIIKLTETIYKPLYNIYNQNLNNESKKYISHIIKYSIWGSAGIVSEWIKNDFKESSAEIADILYNLSANGINHFT